MRDKEFDNIFKQALETEQSFEFNSADADDVVARAQVANGASSGGFLAGGVAANKLYVILLTLTLAALVFTIYKLLKIDNRIQHLEEVVEKTTDERERAMAEISDLKHQLANSGNNDTSIETLPFIATELPDNLARTQKEPDVKNNKNQRADKLPQHTGNDSHEIQERNSESKRAAIENKKTIQDKAVVEKSETTETTLAHRETERSLTNSIYETGDIATPEEFGNRIENNEEKKTAQPAIVENAANGGSNNSIAIPENSNVPKAKYQAKKTENNDEKEATYSNHRSENVRGEDDVVSPAVSLSASGEPAETRTFENDIKKQPAIAENATLKNLPVGENAVASETEKKENSGEPKSLEEIEATASDNVAEERHDMENADKKDEAKVKQEIENKHKPEKKKRNFQFEKTNNWTLGGTFGFGAASEAFIDERDETIEGGITLGVRAEFSPIKHLSIFTDFDFQTTRNVIHDLDDYDFDDDSIVFAEHEDPYEYEEYSWETTDARSFTLKNNFGIKVNLLPERKFNPYFSTSILTQLHMATKLNYHYLEEDDDDETETIETAERFLELRLGAINFAGGFEYFFANQWKLQFETYYNHALEEAQFPIRIGFKTGLLHTF